MRRSRMPALGVDLIEASQAKSFYRRHARRLGELLAPHELAYVRAGRPAYERLAEVLAAKEAAFKASSGSWMGREGFRALHLSRRGGKWNWGRFEVSFIRHKKYLIARLAERR